MSKATKGYKREHGLTVEQYNAIDLLVIGKSDQETADIIGVNRVTVTKWRNYDLHFMAELNKRRKEVWSASIDKMRALIRKAMERLEKEIESENGWKVSLELIKLSGIENKHIQSIGHDEVEKIIEEEAEQRSTEKLFSTVSDFSKEELVNEYKRKLETS